MDRPWQTHELEAAHKHCTHNRRAIQRSTACACFYCLEIFPGSEVDEWIQEMAAEAGSEEGPTALCPRCGIDSVLPGASGLPVQDAAFLQAMHGHWFG
jgi:hypothetical protein